MIDIIVISIWQHPHLLGNITNIRLTLENTFASSTLTRLFPVQNKCEFHVTSRILRYAVSEASPCTLQKSKIIQGCLNRKVKMFIFPWFTTLPMIHFYILEITIHSHVTASTTWHLQWVLFSHEALKSFSHRLVLTIGSQTLKSRRNDASITHLLLYFNYKLNGTAPTAFHPEPFTPRTQLWCSRQKLPWFWSFKCSQSWSSDSRSMLSRSQNLQFFQYKKSSHVTKQHGWIPFRFNLIIVFDPGKIGTTRHTH